MGDALFVLDGNIQIPCGECNKKNAIPVGKLQDAPVCGACGAKLSAPDKPIELDDNNFQQVIESSPLPVLVDFWAPWCGPCRMMTPILERYAQQKAGTVLVGKLNTDGSPQTASGLGIQGIPTLIVFHAGKEINRQVGLVPENVLDSLLPS